MLSYPSRGVKVLRRTTSAPFRPSWPTGKSECRQLPPQFWKTRKRISSSLNSVSYRSYRGRNGLVPMSDVPVPTPMIKKWSSPYRRAKGSISSRLMGIIRLATNAGWLDSSIGGHKEER